VALGCPPLSAAGYTSLIALQTLAGTFIWLWIRGSLRKGSTADSLELIGMGLALGTIIALVSGVALLPLMPARIAWMVLPLIVILIGVVWARRHSATSLTLSITKPAGLAAASGVLVGAASAWVNLRRYPLSSSTVFESFHGDMLYFQGLSTSIAKFGPWNSVFFSEGDIRYHWFAYGWIGQLDTTLGSEPFLGLTRVLPIMALVGLVCLAASWASRLSTSRWAPILAVMLIVIGGFVGALFGTVLNFDSPSQAVTAFWLVAFAYATWLYLERQLSHRALLPIALLAIALIGGKVSSGITAIICIGSVLGIALLVRRDLMRRALAVFGVTTVASGLTYVLILAGGSGAQAFRILSLGDRASTVQGLNPGVSAAAIVAGTIALILAVVPRWLGVFILSADPRSRRNVITLMGWGFVLSGLLPLVVLSQGLNEIWFAVSASAPLSVITAVALADAWERAARPRLLVICVIIGLLASLFAAVALAQGNISSTTIKPWGPMIVYIIAILGGLSAWLILRSRGSSGAGLLVFVTILVCAALPARLSPELAPKAPQFVLPAAAQELIDQAFQGQPPWIPPLEVNAKPIDTTPQIDSWSTEELEASAFLIANSDDADIVATNDTAGFLVPALTSRLTFITGSAYQAAYGTNSVSAAVPSRIRDSHSFVRSADRSAYEALCRSGVTWLWVAAALDSAADWSPYADIVFTNDAVTLAKLHDDPACSL
jgi:hypothetical protein